MRTTKPSEAAGYTYVEIDGGWWQTLAGRWCECPKCDRILTYREFGYGSSGMCASCRPDLLPPKPPKARASKKGLKK